MTATEAAGGVDASTDVAARPWFERLVRRYEPAVAAFVAAFLVVQLVPPLHQTSTPRRTVAPFTNATKPSAPSATVAGAAAPPASTNRTPDPGGTGSPTGTTGGLPTGGSPSAAPPSIEVLTHLSVPPGAGGVAVTSDGSILATLGGSSPGVARLRPDGSFDQIWPLGAAPLDPTAVVAGAGVHVYVATASPAQILTLNTADGSIQIYGSIPNVAPCIPVARTTNCDASIIDREPRPSALAFDQRGDLLVADAGQGAIWLIPASGGAARQWLVDPSFGRADRPSGPTGIAIDGAGDVVFAIPATLTADAGVVYLQSRTADGRPGPRTTLATLEAGAHPSSLVLSAGGTIFTCLPDSSHVLELGTDGKELRRIEIDASLGAGLLAGLAFHNESLLAAGRSVAGAPTAIVRVPVGETRGVIGTGPT